MAVVICKEQALKIIEDFKSGIGFEDPVEITSDGKETSVTPEMSTSLLYNVMTGNTELSKEEAAHTLRTPIPMQGGETLTRLTFVPRKLKRADLASVNTAKDEESAVKELVKTIFDISDYVFSELEGKDIMALTAIAAYTSFM